MNNEEKQLPIGEAAKHLNTTPLNVLMHIKRGLLQGADIDGQWWIDRESLAELLEKRQEGTVEQVCASGCGRHQGCGGGCG